MSRPRRKREPVKLAKVIRFEPRSNLPTSWRIMTRAADQAEDAWKVIADPKSPEKPCADLMTPAVVTALLAQYDEVVKLVQDEVRACECYDYGFTAKNIAAMETWRAILLKFCRRRVLLASLHERFQRDSAPLCPVLELATFRRFRNRVVGKGATP